jgi:glutamine cyclotransferase
MGRLELDIENYDGDGWTVQLCKEKLRNSEGRPYLDKRLWPAVARGRNEAIASRGEIASAP